MISPSGGVPERGLDWFFVATEACGGGTSDISTPLGFSYFCGIYRAKGAVQEATEVGTTHLGAPWWVVLPLEPPTGTSLAHQVSSGPEKFSKKLHRVWTPFGTDILRSKKQAKTSDWHWALCQ